MMNKKPILYVIFIVLIITASLISGGLIGFLTTDNASQMKVWDIIAQHEKELWELYSTVTQQELKEWLPDKPLNFTDGLVWESQHLNFTQDRPKYQNVTQVLSNGIGACGEHVLVYAAFCVANDIPFRVIHLGYFVPNVVDHSWIQVNPSHDRQTWIHIEVSDTCARLDNGETIDSLWNVTINKNDYYRASDYKMVLAYELNERNEIIITDVTSTFSPKS